MTNNSAHRTKLSRRLIVSLLDSRLTSAYVCWAAKPVKEGLRRGYQEGKAKASVETMAYYNMILTEAVFQLLEEKGLLKRQEVKDRIEKLKADTKLSFQMIQ
jgi:hypothetical protein